MTKFVVTLYPCTLELRDWGGFYTTKIDLFGGTYPKLTFETKTTDEVLDIVTGFAEADGGSVNACVTKVGPGRKPNGFDKRTKGLYFNVETIDMKTKEAVT